MIKNKTVVLRGIKDAERKIRLDYEFANSERVQRRFSERLCLKPNLSLSGYSCRAVMDWIEIEVDLRRPTQFRFVKTTLDALGINPFVTPQDPSPGGVADVYRIRIQEPHSRLLQDCTDALSDKFGLRDDPGIVELEISVDFTPRNYSSEDRGRLVGILGRHLFPGRDFITDLCDRPRFAWGRDRKYTNRLFKGSLNPAMDNIRLTSSEGDTPASVDATFYVGRKGGEVSWRIMEKVLDKQNPKTGTREELPREERKARVEVTLGRRELSRLKLEKLSDMRGFRFSRLQGEYFRFMLPTFSQDLASGTPVGRNRENERLNRFLNAGVVGLVAMDDGRMQFRRRLRPNLVRHLHQRGKTVGPVRRVGTGAASTFVAYQELNERVVMALRKLSQRESGD